VEQTLATKERFLTKKIKVETTTKSKDTDGAEKSRQLATLISSTSRLAVALPESSKHSKCDLPLQDAIFSHISSLYLPMGRYVSFPAHAAIAQEHEAWRDFEPFGWFFADYALSD
jgi:hypothetical protein